MRSVPILVGGVVAAVATSSLAAASMVCFPDNFLWGTATASYQVEGGWNDGGRTPSIWDDFCRQEPKVACANVADDFYHRYAQDIQMMKDAGHTAFRFSVSWSRAMNWDPATKRLKPNPPGLAFYHAVVDALVNAGIAPVLTIYHWDLPDELQTQISPPAWLNPEIQGHFLEFATLLFKEFGDKVDYWTTFNEPWAFTFLGYSADESLGIGFAPGPKPSDTDQYIAAHNVLISHAKAVQKFRELKTQKVIHDKAVIAIVLTGDHNLPLDPSNPKDVDAAERTYQFTLGWFLEPIVSGDYPAVMRERVGDRLPKFTPEETVLLKGSYDIFNVNHYGTHQCTDCNAPGSTVKCDQLSHGWARDLGVDNTIKPPGYKPSAKGKDGKELCGYFSAYPTGYRGIIRWVHEHNKTTPILLTENGFCGNDDVEGEDRLWYHQTYLEQVHLSIVEEKIPILGYMAWSLLDNYELGSFEKRFGLYYVNYTAQSGAKESWTPKPTELARVPRLAAKFYSKLAKSGCMETYQGDEQAVQAEPTTAAGASSNRGIWVALIVVVVVVVGGLAGVAIHRFRRGASTAQENAALLRP